MKPYKAFAALIAAGMVGTAFAATIQPTWRAETEYKFADEPVARPLKADAAGDQIVNDVIQALNKDDSLKGSKITVSTDQGVVTLTGRTDTQQQADAAVQVAAAAAGGRGNVINVIQPAKISYQTPEEQAGLKKLAEMPDETLSPEEMTG